MAKIILRGGITHEVTNEEAQAIKSQWENATSQTYEKQKREMLGQLASTKNHSFRLADIKDISLDMNARSTYVEDAFTEWSQSREKFYKYSAEEKANVTLAGQVVLALHLSQNENIVRNTDGSWTIAEPYRTALRLRLIDWFGIPEHRYRCLADFSIFIEGRDFVGKTILQYDNRAATYMAGSIFADREEAVKREEFINEKRVEAMVEAPKPALGLNL